MSEAGLPIPEALLVPLLDTAGDLMRHLEANDLPMTLRRVATFDRRALARGVARHQLLAAIESEEDFRKVVFERFLERDEVANALRGWDAQQAVARAEAAAERSDLPLLTSALFAARPRGFGFGIGVAVAIFESRRRDQAETDDFKAMQTQVSAAEEARRRSDNARAAAEAQVQKLDAELKEERRSRRTREDAAATEVAAAAQRATKAEAEAERERRQAANVEERRVREAERAREAEREAKELRAEVQSLEDALRTAQADLARAPAAGSGLRQADLQALADAAAIAQRLADGLTGVVEHARKKGVMRDAAASDASPEAPTAAPAAPKSAPTEKPKTAPARRTPVAVPPGMLADAPEAVDAMLRTPNAVLLVDGYNVTMEGWSDLGKADQRERLVTALRALHLRTRCSITVVFDGADVGAMRSPRQPGVRVLFSSEGEEADDVIVQECTTLPVSTPVLVVSTDGWVRTETERLGARAVPARALLRVLR